MNPPFKRIKTIWAKTADHPWFNETPDMSDCMMFGMFFLLSPIYGPMIILGLIPFLIMDLFDIGKEYVRQNR